MRFTQTYEENHGRGLWFLTTMSMEMWGRCSVIIIGHEDVRAKTDYYRWGLCKCNSPNKWCLFSVKLVCDVSVQTLAVIDSVHKIDSLLSARIGRGQVARNITSDYAKCFPKTVAALLACELGVP
jgi:hypothetical protein